MERVDRIAKVRELLEGGAGEALPGSAAERYLPLVTLDSGARVGLDREAHWVIVPDDGRAPVRWSEGAAHLFHEPLEWKRARFDDAVEDAARALGLPAEDVLFSFPVTEIVRAVLAKEQPYMTRLALEWLRTTDLRALRREILAVLKQDNMPVPVKDLAQRLVVPE
ncbi:Hypothetical protein A7982_03164 [Minicystis rosea]|nr:Hypothetical protein A7982_03164 [Minicystis rosea]